MYVRVVFMKVFSFDTTIVLPPELKIQAAPELVPLSLYCPPPPGLPSKRIPFQHMDGRGRLCSGQLVKRPHIKSSEMMK